MVQFVCDGSYHTAHTPAHRKLFAQNKNWIIYSSIFVKWQISKQNLIAKCNKNKIIKKDKEKLKVVYVYLFEIGVCEWVSVYTVQYEFK